MWMLLSTDGFQSTLPRGERPGGLNPGDMFEISIHAPARGATHLPKTLFRFGAFQSTLPRGERHGQRRWAAACKNFNPRSREGSDSDGELVDLLKEISIHAPARGATHVATNLTNGAKISIHAPARGATVRGKASDPAYPDFNPRSREGSDVNPGIWQNLDAGFQSTLPRGERQHLLPEWYVRS